MSGWRGSIANLVPDAGWRKLLDVSLPHSKDNTETIVQARKHESVFFSTIAANFATQKGSSKGTYYVTPADSIEFRRSLVRAGGVVSPLDSQAHSASVIRAWSCASRRRVGKRQDLAEMVGIRIFETAEGNEPPLPNVLDFSEPVDLVYTWVDGSDADWRKDRDAVAKSHGTGDLPTAVDEARFTSNDELKYSLRSVEAFLPWVNHIYIVTSGQIPRWLDTDHPSLTVVTHGEIFRRSSDLPTFNSHAIEAQIHRIKGLSEHFIYVNDDVMFGRPMGPEAFYTPHGQARFELSARHFECDQNNGLPVDIAAQNNAAVMRERFGFIATYKFKHVAHAQRKSVLERIEQDFPDSIARTAGQRFRSSTDLSIPSSLAHYYGLALGKAVPGSATYKYIDLGTSRAQLELSRLLWSERPQMICLNQVSDAKSDPAREAKILHHFLEKAYPLPSSMERTTGF